MISLWTFPQETARPKSAVDLYVYLGVAQNHNELYSLLSTGFLLSIRYNILNLKNWSKNIRSELAKIIIIVVQN